MRLTLDTRTRILIAGNLALFVFGSVASAHSAWLDAAKDPLGRSGPAGSLADFLRGDRVPAAMRPGFRRPATGR
jgi:hypothetical protein